ncbi:MAG: BlaI/MecI/CopY family transcriptional regulator, partial [Planctomycetota bacterium]
FRLGDYKGARLMQDRLSRRERQILEIIYQCGEASANDITDALSGNIANATVRTQLRSMETKGVLRHRQEGKKFIYRPRTPRKSAASRAFRKVLDIFFGGSVGDALAAHLADPKTKLDQEQIERLKLLIDEKALDNADSKSSK